MLGWRKCPKLLRRELCTLWWADTEVARRKFQTLPLVAVAGQNPEGCRLISEWKSSLFMVSWSRAPWNPPCKFHLDRPPSAPHPAPRSEGGVPVPTDRTGSWILSDQNSVGADRCVAAQQLWCPCGHPEGPLPVGILSSHQSSANTGLLYSFIQQCFYLS